MVDFIRDSISAEDHFPIEIEHPNASAGERYLFQMAARFVPIELQAFLTAFQAQLEEINPELARTFTVEPIHQEYNRPAPVLRHPNEAYAPGLFRIPNGREIIGQVLQTGRFDASSLRSEHPGVPLTSYEEFDRFRETPTFFQAISAPEDLDDVFGEPYRGKRHIYVLAAPKKIEQLIFYSSEELVQSFLTYQDWCDPKDIKRTFSKAQMDRLLYLASMHDDVLAETIEHVQVYTLRAVKETRALYEKCPDQLKLCLRQLLDASMYMRGWSGEGRYPLSSLETVGDYDKVRLSEQLMKLQVFIERNLDFARLSLMLYVHGRWRDGSTHLSERLHEVIQGQACIRETSNLFAATSWFYLNEFYKEPPFELERLREIM